MKLNYYNSLQGWITSLKFLRLSASSCMISQVSKIGTNILDRFEKSKIILGNQGYKVTKETTLHSVDPA